MKLLKFEKLFKINKEGMTKVLLSVGLFIYSVYIFGVTSNHLIPIAMFLSLLGDIAIMSSRGVFNRHKEKSFIYGPVFFAMSHMVYITAMETKFVVPVLLIDSLLFIGILVIVFLLNKKKSNLVNTLYALILVSNLFNSFFYSKLAFVGLIFFCISDAILSLKEQDKPYWQKPIWITYVIAQLCILTTFLI